MKNKKIIITGIVALLIIVLSIMSTGFRKRSDVVLTNYSVSQDGNSIKMNVAITSSMGYTRAMNVKQGGDNKYITFYSTFGLFNSKVGAKSEFELELNPSCEEIYFYYGDGGYDLVLKKDNETNKWNRVQDGVALEDELERKFDKEILVPVSNSNSPAGSYVWKNFNITADDNADIIKEWKTDNNTGLTYIKITSYNQYKKMKNHLSNIRELTKEDFVNYYMMIFINDNLDYTLKMERPQYYEENKKTLSFVFSKEKSNYDDNEALYNGLCIIIPNYREEYDMDYIFEE